MISIKIGFGVLATDSLISGAGADPKAVLVNAPPGYRLNAADADCDIGHFVAFKAAGVQAAAAGQFEQTSRHLTDALARMARTRTRRLRDVQFVEAFATAVTEGKVVAHTANAERS